MFKPSWHTAIVNGFEGLKTKQFLLHGNTADLWLKEQTGELNPNAVESSLPQQINLSTYLQERMLSKFHVILTYQVGEGIEVVKGQEILKHYTGTPQPFARNTPLNTIDTLQKINLFLDHYSIHNKKSIHVSFIIKDAHLITPNEASNLYYELNTLSSVLKSWSQPNPNQYYHLVSFIIAEQLNEINRLLRTNSLAQHVHVSLPDAVEIESNLKVLAPFYTDTLKDFPDLSVLANKLKGLSLLSLNHLLKNAKFTQQPIDTKGVANLRKSLVEKESNGLIEFIESKRSLDDLKGQTAFVEYLRTDLKLFREGVIKAVPMGYLFSGPVGCGKSFTVNCIAGEAQVPAVVIKNFRDKWVGSSEGNLEKIFQLIRALGQCIVFVDEADQALGKRDQGSSGSDVGGRLYGMMAEFMSNPDHRGKILWILATSRPDLVEIDLKRPGRIDTKIPLLPTLTKQESYDLIRTLMKVQGMEISATFKPSLEIPLLLTPGAVTAMTSQLFKQWYLTKTDPNILLAKYLKTYEPPIPEERLKFQMRLSLEETTEPSLVPAIARKLAAASV